MNVIPREGSEATPLIGAHEPPIVTLLQQHHGLSLEQLQFVWILGHVFKESTVTENRTISSSHHALILYFIKSHLYCTHINGSEVVVSTCKNSVLDAFPFLLEFGTLSIYNSSLLVDTTDGGRGLSAPPSGVMTSQYEIGTIPFRFAIRPSNQLSSTCRVNATNSPLFRDNSIPDCATNVYFARASPSVCFALPPLDDVRDPEIN